MLIGVAFWNVFGSDKFKYTDSQETCTKLNKNSNCTSVRVEAFETIEKTFYNIIAVAFQLSLTDDDKKVSNVFVVHCYALYRLAFSQSRFFMKIKVHKCCFSFYRD